MNVSPHIMLARLAATLERYRIDLSTEMNAHRDIAAALTAAGVAFEREVALSPRDRVDFMADGIAIEVKTQGQRVEIVRQLQRYAESDAVRGLILLTAKTFPGSVAEIGRKPLRVVKMGAAWL